MIVCESRFLAVCLTRRGRTHSHDEGVCEAGDGVCELVCELDVMMIEPSSSNYGDTIKAGDASLGEETGEEVANNTTDRMGRENLCR